MGVQENNKKLIHFTRIGVEYHAGIDHIVLSQLGKCLLFVRDIRRIESKKSMGNVTWISDDTPIS